jgi:hypothetical protein
MTHLVWRRIVAFVTSCKPAKYRRFMTAWEQSA